MKRLAAVARVAVLATVLLSVGSPMGGNVRMAQGANTKESAHAKEAAHTQQSLWDYTTRTLEGESKSLSAYRGKVALVVNVASKCGYTPQYEGLEKLYKEYEAKGFTILGFPSNDFGKQEPGTPHEIRTFCDTKYGVTFPLFEKRDVKGDKKDEIYRFLTKDQKEPEWNFTKYLVGKDGKVLARFAPKVTPDDPALREAIQKALAG